MSMNLNGRVVKTGEEVMLRQTPTWLSYMCVDHWKKDKNGFSKQRHWKDTRKLYLDWCSSFTQGVFKVGEAEIEKEWFEDHRDYIMSLGKIEWWVM